MDKIENFDSLANAITDVRNVNRMNRRVDLHDHFYSLNDKNLTVAWVEVIDELNERKNVIELYRVLVILLSIWVAILFFI